MLLMHKTTNFRYVEVLEPELMELTKGQSFRLYGLDRLRTNPIITFDRKYNFRYITQQSLINRLNYTKIFVINTEEVKLGLFDFKEIETRPYITVNKKECNVKEYLGFKNKMSKRFKDFIEVIRRGK
ncbi:MAG: hypothetical protein ACRCYT_08450 [Cetobacterium sp.]